MPNVVTSAKNALPLLKCFLAICLLVYYFTIYATSCHDAKNSLTTNNSLKLKGIIKSIPDRLPCVYAFLRTDSVSSVTPLDALEKCLEELLAQPSVGYWALAQHLDFAKVQFIQSSITNSN